MKKTYTNDANRAFKFAKIKIDGIKNGNKQKMPLCSTQESIWMTQKLYHGSSVFNIGGYAVYNVNIDEKVYARAIEQIINEHDAFCLEFIEDEANVYQRIRDNSDYYIFYNNECRSEEEILDFIHNDMLVPFTLKEQIFKFTIFKVSENKCYVSFKAHHMIFDGYSASIYVKRLEELYKQLINGGKSELNTIKINSYANFINHELTYKGSKKYDSDKSFWIELLKEEQSKAFESCMQLSNPAVAPARRKSIVIKREVYNEILSYCSTQNVTVYHYFIASIYMLNRLYNNNIFVLGLPILNRSTSEHKKTIGAFISVIPFLPDKREFNSFEGLLSIIKSSLLNCYRHQKYPFSDLALSLNRPGLLYNICFSYQRTEYPTEFKGKPTSTVFIGNGHQQEDMAIHLIENVYNDKEDVVVYFDYKEAVFSEEIIINLMNHFNSFVTNVFRNAETDLKDIEYMPEKEKKGILAGFNDTMVDFPKYKCMHQLFEEQVRKNPDSTAVVFRNKSITYKELNEMCNSLAAFLQAENVRTNTLVGICMERSIEMVLAIMGILKAGGAYVPIDPEYPDERLNYMIEDSNVPIILTQSHLSNKLSKSNSMTIKLDSEWEWIKKHGNAKIEADVSPDNWAYMIYTSGSTGRPKGAINTHKGLVNRINWMQKEFKLSQRDAVLQKTPFSFDVSVWEFVWPLAAGARIVMAEPGGHRDPVYLVNTICHYNITTIHFVPSMLRIFLSEGTAKNCKPLKRIICSGEELKTDLQNECLRKINAELYNLYGPTEAAIDVSYWKCRLNDKLRTVPIGKPIDNIELYILSKDLKLLPVGVAGELHIAGVGLAVGYHNKAELTSEKFIPNPYSMQGYNRMYKTGDLARWLPDGNIEYLGRVDHQVKINGLRIELGEIEYQISRIEGIEEVKVIDRTDGNDNKFLAAYITLKKQTAKHDNDYIRNHLRKSIPAFMIPSLFIYMDKLPLSPNGKLDRKTLPDCDLIITHGRGRIKPVTKEEKELVSIFEEVLGLNDIGVTDNFFDLGGTSLKGIQIVSKYKAITIQELFQYPSVREIINYLTNHKLRKNKLLTTIKKSPTGAIAIICIPYGGGSPVIYEGLSKVLPNDYSIYSVDLPGHNYSNDESKLKSVEETAALLSDEVINEIDSDIVLYGHCVGCALTYEVAKKLEMNKTEVKAVFMAATFPFFPKNIKGFLSQRLVRYYYSNDKRTYGFLKKLGGFQEAIDTEALKELLTWFRHDGLEMINYFKALEKSKAIYQLNAPIVSITGDEDPLTKFFLKEVKQWERLTSKVYYRVIEGGKHYFIHTNAVEVAGIIKNTLFQSKNRKISHKKNFNKKDMRLDA